HLVAKNGKPLIDELVVRGRKLVIKQLPIKSGDVVVGAVGFAIFNETSQVLDLARKLFNIELEPSINNYWKAKYNLKDIIGSSKQIEELKKQIKRISQSNSSVLIYGESGTGKELIAHSIHTLSNRSSNPFVRINCSAIPRELLEAELFGYEGGAFTGARQKGQIGKVELANSGTLFLDEIGDMPLPMQSSLLRVLQEKEIVRVGGTKPIPVDVRVICATHRNLHKHVIENQFRQDLYYRINIFTVKVPSLRERTDDLPELINHFLLTLRSELGLGELYLTDELMDYLKKYSWPGNIRELRNVIEHAVHFVTGNQLKLEHLPELSKLSNISNHNTNLNLNENVKAVEYATIQTALNQTNGNKTRAAKLLGIDRSQLYKKLREYE
ncbi:sigma-54 interaction domain-containing protein, partial [Bacillus sp. JJ1474]